MANDAWLTWPKQDLLSPFLGLPSLSLAIVSPTVFSFALYSTFYSFFLIHICAVLHHDRCSRCSLQRNEEIILLVIFQAPWLLYVSSFFLCLLCDLSPATLCSLWSLFGKEKRSVQGRKTFKQPDLQGNENRNFQGTRVGFAELATTLKPFLLLLLFYCCLFVF